jgi:hypothetical protein
MIYREMLHLGQEVIVRELGEELRVTLPLGALHELSSSRGTRTT